MAGLQIVGAFAILIVSILWRGYVISVLWLWFVASQFGALAVSVPQAVGLALVLRMFTHRHRPAGDTTFAALAFDELFTPLLTLGVAAVVRGFL